MLKTYLKKFSILRFFKIYITITKNKFLYNTLEKQEKYIKKQFKECLDYEIDFNKQPVTFNQKIQFRKLYDNNPLYSICADKYRVREYVKEKIGEEYLIPLYLVTDKLTEEQWDKLPNSFVAKANHNSGPVQIVKDKNKVNKKEIIRELNNQLKLDFGSLTLEKYYSDIPRKIIVEKFLKENIEDYKFNCFNNGEIILERVTKASEISNMYDPYSWKQLNFTTGNKIDLKKYEKPQNFEKMLEIVKILSEDFEYVRVDLYNIEGKIYVGELTFCESSGFGKFTDEKWDYKFGEFWEQKKLK
ncbi:ATP-grasp fold amidoligase family protein [Fusobacterium sp.]|uniref:ATP-grasp fold amidoligase family protein n=1 Tax=Fusobacterium sp. TaxID=68766 RepID=UPI0025C5FE32|nr:ATP-grasp fold amidoligase family protein [Fusobacterium sp.]